MVAEQQLRELAREDEREQRRDRRRPRDRRRRRARDPRAALLIFVKKIKTDERLADADAQEDAREDHRRQQRVGRAVAGRRDVPRVQRNRDERDALRDDVAELVGRAGRQQPLQVAEHGLEPIRPARLLCGALAGAPRSAPRQDAAKPPADSVGAAVRARQRQADAEQRPRQRVLEEVGVGERVQHERREAGRDRRRARSASAERGEPTRSPPAAASGRRRGTATRTRRPAARRTAPARRCPARRRPSSGIVCDADVAFSAPVFECSSYSRLERARAVALQRTFGEQFEAAFDQLAAPARRVARRAAEPFSPKCALVGASSTTSSASTTTPSDT